MNENFTINSSAVKSAREKLYVPKGATLGLKVMYKYYKILAVIIPFFIAATLLLYGLFDGGFGSIALGIWIALSALINWIVLQIFNAFITMTKAAEYYIAIVQKTYDVHD